ncbi:hypothetical protein Tco_0246768 [Tanacetum coccineum]
MLPGASSRQKLSHKSVSKIWNFFGTSVSFMACRAFQGSQLVLPERRKGETYGGDQNLSLEFSEDLKDCFPMKLGNNPMSTEDIV